MIDPDGGFAYFGSGAGKIVKIRLSDFTRVDTLTLNPSETELFCCHRPRGWLRILRNKYGARIARVRLSDFTHDEIARGDTLTLEARECYLTSAVIDAGARWNVAAAIFGTSNDPGMIVKVSLSDFTRVNTLTLDSSEGSRWSAVIDAANGFGYFGTWTIPGKIVKVNLSDFTRIDTLTLGSGEGPLISAAIDAVGDSAYFGTGTYPGEVIEVRLSDLIPVDALTLDAGEDLLASALIDTASGFTYFGTNTEPGKIVKVGSGAPTIQVIIDSNPLGWGFVKVDDTTVTTPQTFSWPQGSAHTLEALSPVAGAVGIRYVFTGWSDGGAQTHAYTTPAGDTSLTVNYKTEYYITVTSPYGSPTSSDWVGEGQLYATSVTNPNGGHDCYGFRIDGGELQPGTSYTFTNVQAPHTIQYVWGGPDPPRESSHPVGGVLVPANKLAILSPYLALVGLVGAVIVVFAVRKKGSALGMISHTKTRPSA